VLVRVMAAWRACVEGERVHGTDGQVRWRCTSEAKSSSGTDTGARASGAVHGRANERAWARCRTRVRAVGRRGQVWIMRSVDGRPGKEETPDGWDHAVSG
jgi:hypothetical protein